MHRRPGVVAAQKQQPAPRPDLVGSATTAAVEVPRDAATDVDKPVVAELDQSPATASSLRSVITVATQDDPLSTVSDRPCTTSTTLHQQGPD